MMRQCSVRSYTDEPRGVAALIHRAERTSIWADHAATAAVVAVVAGRHAPAVAAHLTDPTRHVAAAAVSAGAHIRALAVAALLVVPARVCAAAAMLRRVDPCARAVA